MSGRGRVTATGSATYTTPLPQGGAYSSFGTLLMEGRREGDTLVFTPQVKIETRTGRRNRTHGASRGEGALTPGSLRIGALDG